MTETAPAAPTLDQRREHLKDYALALLREIGLRNGHFKPSNDRERLQALDGPCDPKDLNVHQDFSGMVQW